MARISVKETGLDFGSLSERATTDALVVHHVGGTDRDVSAAEIHQWHKNQGWSGIGYHYVIRKDGTVERGRPRVMLGAHCQGDNNHSIGINVVGDFEAAEPTQAQLDSLAKLCADLCDIYGLPASAIHGHRDYMQTDCPGNNLYTKLWQVIQKVDSMLKNNN